MSPASATPEASGPQAAGVVVRHIHELREFEQCMELERLVWASSDADVVPLPIFVVAAHTGGQVLGAWDGGRMIGFTLSMTAFRQGRTALHSHMTAVLAEYRDRGVGRQLKLFQREDALARGIGLVEWTFDPLELKNAYFNLERLGAVVREFLPNAYGITTSPLHAGLPTDRLLAEWWLDSPRVRARCSGGFTPPHSPEAGAVGPASRISVPVGIGELKKTNPAEAARIQSDIREQFQDSFARGLVVTGMEINQNTGDYLLEPLSDPQAAACPESAAEGRGER